MPVVLSPSSFLQPLSDIINDILGLEDSPDFIQGITSNTPHAKQQIDAVGNHMEIQGNMVPFQTIQDPGG